VGHVRSDTQWHDATDPATVNALRRTAEGVPCWCDSAKGDGADREVCERRHRRPGQAANSVGASEFAANAVSGSKVGSNVLTGADINEATLANVQADTVDGHGANELARVAGQSTNNAMWSEDGRTVLQTVTITAPQQGFVFLSGSANVYLGEYGCDYCGVHLRFHDVEANTDTVTSGTVTLPGSAYEPLAFSVTLPVTAGTHTFQLVGTWFDPAGDLEPNWIDTSASALFFRFNGSGTSVASPPGRSSTHK